MYHSPHISFLPLTQTIGANQPQKRLSCHFTSSLCLCPCFPFHPVHICKPVIHFQIFHHLKRCKCAIRCLEASVYDLIPTLCIYDPKVKAHSFHHYSLLSLYLTTHLPYLAAPFLPLSLHSPLNCLKYPSKLNE